MMPNLSKDEVKQQILLQTHLFQNLKRWLNLALFISSLLFSVTVFGKQNAILFWIAVIALTLSIAITLVIGLALKRGQDNLKKLIQLLDAN